MKIAVCSDLHLEFGDLVLPNPGCDVLVLSGDILIAHELSVYMKHNPHAPLSGSSYEKGERYYNFLKNCVENFKKVVYVAGNHEFYHSTVEHTIATLEEVSSELGIAFLNDGLTYVNGVCFMGGTLWTNMNNLDFLTMNTCGNTMNDYRQVRYEKMGYRRLLPKDTVGFHSKTLSFLRDNLPLVGKTVVVTHHSPSRQSIHPRYVNDEEINGAYSSNLDEFLMDHPNIALWTHGHTHHNFDYTVGNTRVFCNPRGYHNYEFRAAEFELRAVEI